MFCFQCQQTAGDKACVVNGVCGKKADTSNLQDDLVKELIRLAVICKKTNTHTKEINRLFVDGLFTTLTNVNFDNHAIEAFKQRVISKQKELSQEEVEKIKELAARLD